MRQYGSDQPGVVTGDYQFRRHASHRVRYQRAENAGLGTATHTRRIGCCVCCAWLDGMTSLDGEANATHARARSCSQGGRMKAFLLAAGRGSPPPAAHRHDRRSACWSSMACGCSISGWTAFCQAGVDEVLVNLHHLPEVVRRHVARSYRACQRFACIYEPSLLGSAGTLLCQPVLGRR